MRPSYASLCSVSNVFFFSGNVTNFPAVQCRKLSFGSADVRGAGMRDEPLRMSAWEAIFCRYSVVFIIVKLNMLCLLQGVISLTET